MKHLHSFPTRRSSDLAVQKILPSMNIWGAKRDLTKQDVNIRLCEASSEQEEVKYIYQEALKGANVGDTSVVLRSEEHTSELQSRGNLVCRLLHEQKIL